MGHVFAVYLYRGLGTENLPGGEPIARLLNMDAETNLPAWLSASGLLLAGVACAAVWAATPRGAGTHRWHWAGLAVLLMFLSLDEAALIHEELSRPLTNRLDLDEQAWRYWAWLLPYGIAALAVAAAYARFVWRLPSRTRAGIVVGGALFVAGAAGMELVGRELFDPFDIDATYLLVVGVEEVLELSGIAVLLVTLVAHLRDHIGPVTVWFGADRPTLG